MMQGSNKLTEQEEERLKEIKRERGEGENEVDTLKMEKNQMWKREQWK